MGHILCCCPSLRRALIDVCSSFQLTNQQKAVDIGKRDCKACIMSSDRSIAEESVYNNTLAEAEIFAYSIVKKW
jgi:hypothetical protein